MVVNSEKHNWEFFLKGSGFVTNRQPRAVSREVRWAEKQAVSQQWSASLQTGTDGGGRRLVPARFPLVVNLSDSQDACQHVLQSVAR